MSDDGEPLQSTVLDLDQALALAVRLHRSGHLAPASELYHRVLASSPDQPDALHFLGVLEHQRGNSERAVALIQRSLALAPAHADAHNNLGNVYRAMGKHPEAGACYAAALRLAPDHPDALVNLGVVLLGAGRLDEAERSIRRALALQPNHTEAYHNLGTVLRMRHQPDQAERAFRRALELRPGHAETYQALALSLAADGKREQAERVLREWLVVRPHDPIAEHLLSALTGESVPTRASDAFVRDTFGRFADDYDEALGRLQYRGPELVAEALAALLPVATGDRVVLDAGCGTGLCGAILRPHARKLIGLDLSSSMLEQARARGHYDELVVAELTAYLDDHPASFNLVIAADTLCYFGDLAPVLSATARALHPGGWLVFTVEHCRDDVTTGFRLEHHGRYAHTQDYVRRTLEHAGLSIERITECQLRHERGQPVAGLVIGAQRRV